MPMNPPLLHCIWSDRKSRFILTRDCEISSFSKGWTYLVPVWTLFGRVLVPCGLVAHFYLILNCGPVFDPCLTVGHLSIICGVGSLLDRIGFLGHFVIGLPIGILSEGLEWAVSLDISAGFIARKFVGWKL